jgi:8-oxo-dGTP diphosphatase
MSERASIHVVAGVLRDRLGRVLVAQRPDGKHLAGYWEFPGGKSEPDELPLDALRREVLEEIGITIESAHPLIAVPHDYPEKRIVLDVWVVDSYSGTPHCRESQALRWVDPDELAGLPMPPADIPAIKALRLPDRYLITPEFAIRDTPALLAGIERACIKRIRLIQLRQPSWPREAVAEAAVAARDICHRYGTELLVNSDWPGATEWGLDGVHLSTRIAFQLKTRPVPEHRWLGISCHGAEDLAHAQRIGADFVTLSPVAPTPSHPDSTPLGWMRFAELVQEAAIPVYALGGLDAMDVSVARGYGAQGMAAIRGLWA